MPEPLKNSYSRSFLQRFATEVTQVVPAFRHHDFVEQVFDQNWEEKELKERMRHIAWVLNHYLPGSYKQQLLLLTRIIEQLKKSGIKPGFEYMFFPDFIEQFGQADVPASLQAMETVTQFTSCEFAIRPFLVKHPDVVMQQMLQWSRHAHPSVRRFSSEGCRPRLPWAMAIPALKKDPAPILPILKNLKSDPSLFVRKSVANNLNDIAKDHPDLVIKLVKKWKGKTKETDWIIRHGCRTLLKKANQHAYALFGLAGSTNCTVQNLKLSASKIRIGERLSFSFDLKPDCVGTLRIEYAVYYAKANGKEVRKLFQLTEKPFEPGAVYTIRKEQRFQDFTTRKHYPGKHTIAIVVNGQERMAKSFALLQ